MTNEKAAIIIGNIPIDGTDDSYTVAEYQEAKAMAIKALKQNESTEEWYRLFVEKFDSCEDCISREAVMQILYDFDCTNEDALMVKEIKALPSVNPQEPMREFTEEEAKAYSKALDKMYKPTGFNVFNEPCDDAISRQAVKEIINDIRDCISVEGYCAILERLKKLPPVRPQEPKRQTWIPVSERLPEVKQHVLLSCYGRVIYGRMISEDGNSGYPVFEICDSVGEKRPIVLETTVHSEFTTSRIIAWMPLPKPYEPKESEETE